jgi:hypothetical protein
MFVRFIIDKRDPDSGRRQGLFQVSWDLSDSGALSAEDDAEIRRIRSWFGGHLKQPDRLALSSRPHAKNTALSWFKDTAIEHITRMREFAQLLEPHGFIVEMIRTDRPGYVLYEDEHQIVAYPFADTPT